MCKIANILKYPKKIQTNSLIFNYFLLETNDLPIILFSSNDSQFIYCVLLSAFVIEMKHVNIIFDSLLVIYKKSVFFLSIIIYYRELTYFKLEIDLIMK